MRVHGSSDAMSFVLQGSTAYVQFERYLKRYFSRSFEDFDRILDWGCGSGRMLRYFPDTVAAKLTGIDIDGDAIEWCRQAFPFGEFMRVETEPPTPIATETFDLIYANSVMTHLGERTHLAWLQELHRLAKPKAIILLTTFGDLAWWKTQFPARLFRDWRIRQSGFFDAGMNMDLDCIGIGEYYRNVFISPEYIASNWSRFFEIIDFVPAAVGNLQDLTILQKNH
jgi:SAM-dependent methyltransferase